MGFFVSRQRDSKDDCLYIEIACGGPKKAGPDILTARYDGEQKNMVDPRDAVNAAERIYKLWDRDYWDEKKQLKIVVDEKNRYIVDFSMAGLTKAKNWANLVYASMDKCGNCQKTMGNKESYEHADLPNVVFCTEMCCARKYRDTFGKEPGRIYSDKDKKAAKFGVKI